jgi:hypothetical protein
LGSQLLQAPATRRGKQLFRFPPNTRLLSPIWASCAAKAHQARMLTTSPPAPVVSARRKSAGATRDLPGIRFEAGMARNPTPAPLGSHALVFI